MSDRDPLTGIRKGKIPPEEQPQPGEGAAVAIVVIILILGIAVCGLAFIPFLIMSAR